MTRSSSALAILGPELHAQLTQTRVLLVGAGGIGCELLKTLLLTGFGHITLLDLDTIDLSNLNRQFLFRKKDVKQPKAIVAAASASQFNPACKIEPLHANIFEPQFDLAWYRSFDIVLNALDNLEARLHVNKMCIAAEVPLVESGTAGYLGQIQPIVKNRTECFACMPKETPKTFPVCTIRSTPSAPIHCIVWAKSYLFSQLFGETGDEEAEFDEALRNGENAEEIEKLRTEAHAFSYIRSSLSAPDGPKQVFNKVFNSDINRLLSMTDMWNSRKPPIPLEYDSIRSGSFKLPPRKRGREEQVELEKETQHGAARMPNGGASRGADGLKDRKELGLEDSLEMFTTSLQKLAARREAGGRSLEFDKDDDDALDFVTATANLRAACYSIPGKTRWEVKEMAGNIIPAIATTNAIISGLIVLQALHLLRKDWSRLRSVFLRSKAAVPLGPCNVVPPNPHCATCRETYVAMPCDSARATLGDVLEALNLEGREVSVYEGQRILSEPDFEDNWPKSLAELGVGRGKSLAVVDEDGQVGNLVLVLEELPAGHSLDNRPFILPDVLPPLPTKPPTVAPSAPPTPAKALKRAAPEDDGEERVAKRQKTSANGINGTKEDMVIEDGVIVLDGADEDVIEID